MGMEYEWKYRATAEILAAVEEKYPKRYNTVKMVTTYFDTAEGALSARRMTLRLRQENDTTVCTFKTTVDDQTRGEWECQCADIGQGIEKLCKLGAPEELNVLTAVGVEPVCGAAFTRRVAKFRFLDAVLELALDEGVLLGGDRQQPFCEIEVEWKSGRLADAEGFCKELSGTFGLQTEKESKFCRAMGLARGE